ncbi:MAG TPA: sugar ABC transporter permease [Candidatus Limnocylindria bacterium]|nr:sugar ABC transporter permease [Candidatus Limnocylindria bacterium]
MSNVSARAIPRQRGVSRLIGGWSLAASLFLAPALFLLAVFMLYPTVSTIVLSFENGLNNYIQLLTRDPKFLDLGRFPPRGALFNNLLWVVFYTSGCVLFGLLIAVMATRVRYEAVIKAIVFLPMAIAATALGLIWRFVYFPNENTGLFNAILGIFNAGPVAWLGSASFVNFALITAGIWGSVGFATVILSAALKSISSEILEAARVDGAREGQIFWRIIVPMLSLPISVVAVTLVINVIKLFDLIFVMSQGGPANSSRVIAFSMYQDAFPSRNFDYGAAIAVIMLLILLPVMAFNVRRFRAERVTQ